MPLRLIGRFDQRWRDTPVKNQQLPVPPLSLCIPLFLHPSFSLSISVSLSVHLISLPLSLAHFSYLLPPSLSSRLCFSSSCKHTHTERVSEATLSPPCFSPFQLPRWLRTHAHWRGKHWTDGPWRSLKPIISLRQATLMSIRHAHE